MTPRETAIKRIIDAGGRWPLKTPPIDGMGRHGPVGVLAVSRLRRAVRPLSPMV